MNEENDFELSFIHSHETYRLTEDHGKVIMITFWASWCPDCGVDLPKKEQLFKSLDEEKVKMITINVKGRERNNNDGRIFTEKFLTQPTLEDNGMEVYNQYKCEGVPTTILINKDGDVTHKFGDKTSFLTIVEAVGTLI